MRHSKIWSDQVPCLLVKERDRTVLTMLAGDSVMPIGGMNSGFISYQHWKYLISVLFPGGAQHAFDILIRPTTLGWRRVT